MGIGENTPSYNQACESTSFMAVYWHDVKRFGGNQFPVIKSSISENGIAVDDLEIVFELLSISVISLSV